MSESLKEEIMDGVKRADAVLQRYGVQLKHSHLLEVIAAYENFKSWDHLCGSIPHGTQGVPIAEIPSVPDAASAVVPAVVVPAAAVAATAQADPPHPNEEPVQSRPIPKRWLDRTSPSRDGPYAQDAWGFIKVAVALHRFNYGTDVSTGYIRRLVSRRNVLQVEMSALDRKLQELRITSARAVDRGEAGGGDLQDSTDRALLTFAYLDRWRHADDSPGNTQYANGMMLAVSEEIDAIEESLKQKTDSPKAA